MKEITDEQYENVKNQALKFYQNNRVINSACFGDVKLTPEGLNHIEWKDKKHKRPRKESYIRYLCFLQTKLLLEKLGLYQEFKEELKSFSFKRKNKIIKENKIINFFGFIGVVNNNKIRVKVVIKKVDIWNKYEFVSVIPAWKTLGYNEHKINDLFFEEKD